MKGTPVREKYESHQFIFDPLPPYQIIESKYLSKLELERIVKLENALEIYWNSKRAINTLKYVTKHYSIFDFLLGLGEYFGTKREYHKYSLDDVYTIIQEFVSINYENDKILEQLIAIDYYLHFKVKPKPLILNELPRNDKSSLIEELKLNHHKYRHIILPINFNFKNFRTNNEVIEQSTNLVIQYNGNTKAEIVW